MAENLAPPAISPTTGYPDEYDFENRLIKRWNSSSIVQLGYDGDGNRIRKKVGSTITHYLVDNSNPTGSSQVLEELVGSTPESAVRNRFHVHGLELINQSRSDASPAWAPQYYGYDGHGSVRFLTDVNGSITDVYTYDAFGILLSPSSPPINNSYLFAGQQYDRDLGCYYNRARYYNGQTGRFWTRDTSDGSEKDPISLHKYLYCSADPINSADPSGHETLLTIQATSAILTFVGSQYLTGTSAALHHIRVHYDTQNSFAELSYGVDVVLAAIDSAQNAQFIIGAATVTTHLLTRGPEWVSKVIRGALQEVHPNWTWIHNIYLKWVRPGAVEKGFKTGWGGLRKLDDYDYLTKTGFEAKTVNWDNIPQDEFQRVMGQIASDQALLKGGQIERMVWFGTRPLGDTGLAGQIKQALKEGKIEYWEVPLF